jgi:hypothetical protein
MAAESKARVATTQVYEVYIKASPQAIWDAITSPEWTVKYAYRGAVEYEFVRAARTGRTRRRRCARSACRMSSLTASSKKPIRRESWCTPIAFCSATPIRRRLHARHMGNREGRFRFLEAHRRARARRRAGHGRHGRQHVLGAGRRRLGVDPQRHEDAARDGQLDVTPGVVADDRGRQRWRSSGAPTATNAR